MLIDFDLVPWSTYAPGVFEQDLFTLPLQGGLLLYMQQYHFKSSKPAWPFQYEATSGQRNSTRHPRSLLVYWGATSTAAAYSYFTFMNDSFPLYTFAVGLGHTHLLTELFTLGAKVGFQRKRPFYDREKRNFEAGIPEAMLRDDDRASFFSGHASHSMAWANYMGLMIRHQLDGSLFSWAISSALWGTAAWVGSARAIDGQHNWSDVIIGSAVGFSVSSFVFHRIETVTLPLRDEQELLVRPTYSLGSGTPGLMASLKIKF